MNVRAIEALARMTAADRGVVVRAASRLFRERLRIRHAPLVKAGVIASGRIDGKRATRLAHLVMRTAESLPFGSSCLHRAVVLASLLRDEDLRSVLCIGVHSDWPERLEAHAWVEHGDLPLLNEEQSAYVPFETLTTEGR